MSISNVASFIEVPLKGIKHLLEALSLTPREAVVDDALEGYWDAP